MQLLAFALAAGLARALTWRGADISSVPVVEAAGVTYRDTTGATGKFENILAAHGMNTARVRVWTAGQYNTAFALSLGKVRQLSPKIRRLSDSSASKPQG